MDIVCRVEMIVEFIYRKRKSSPVSLFLLSKFWSIILRICWLETAQGLFKKWTKRWINDKFQALKYFYFIKVSQSASYRAFIIQKIIKIYRGISTSFEIYLNFGQHYLPIFLRNKRYLRNIVIADFMLVFIGFTRHVPKYFLALELSVSFDFLPCCVIDRFRSQNIDQVRH